MGAEFSSLLGLPTAPTSPPQPAPPVTQAPPVLTTTPAAPAPPPATTAPRNTPPSLTPPPATKHTPTGGGTSSPPDPATTPPPDPNPPSSPLSTHAPSSRSQVSHPASDPDTSAAVDDANLSQTSSGSSIPLSGPLNSLSAPDASVLLPITDPGIASASGVPPEGFSLSSGSGSDDLPAGTIAGIAVGCAAMLFLVGLASVCLRRRVRRQRLHNDSIRTLTPVEIYADVEDSATGSSIHSSSSESDAPLRAWAPRPGVLEPLRRSNRHLSGTPPTQDPTSPPTPANLSAETLYPATGSSEKSGYISNSSGATPSPPPPPPEIEPNPTQTQAQARMATIENAMRHLPSRERLRVTSLAHLYMHRRAYDRELDVESSAGCGGGDVDSDGEERLPVYSRT